MPRGRHAQIGDESISKNGYASVKTEEGWKLKHHIIAERLIGRPIDTKYDRVTFKDGNRNNLDPKNIQVKRKKMGKQQRIDTLQRRIDRAVEELDELTEGERAL